MGGRKLGWEEDALCAFGVFAFSPKYQLFATDRVAGRCPVHGDVKGKAQSAVLTCSDVCSADQQVGMDIWPVSPLQLQVSPWPSTPGLAHGDTVKGRGKQLGAEACARA